MESENRPTPEEALEVLDWLLGLATYQDLDATTDEGANTLLARWEIGHVALNVLAAEID